MQTQLLPVTDAALEKAAEILREGGLVAFPTETVYGLGANALNPEAVAAIFAAKGRPADNPLIAHICDTAQLDGLVRIPDAAPALMEAFWPGPLTILMPRTSAVPDVVKEWQFVEDLAFDKNPIADVPQWLTSMPKLRNVSFSGCRVAKLPEDLSGWKKLSTLVLSGCPIPETEMKRIRAALPDVAILF